MKRLIATLLALAFIAVAAADDDEERAEVRFLDEADEYAGSAEIREGPEGVVLRVKLEGLEPGWKAIHIHETGECHDHEEGFQASGGHLDPDEREHGLLNPEGPEAGDLPNLHVHEDGTARAEIYAPGVSVHGDDRRPGLLPDDGTALVVHEDPDDHVSQPIGGAGGRVACGVVRSAE